MRYLLLGMCLLLPFLSLAQDEIEYKEYSYTEFFKMIEDHEDSVVRLSNIIVKPNPGTDQDFAADFGDSQAEGFGQNFLKPLTSTKKIVTKRLSLRNIEFRLFNEEDLQGTGTPKLYGLFNIVFKRQVFITNVINLLMADSNVEQGMTIGQGSDYQEHFDHMNDDTNIGIMLTRNTFNKYLRIYSRDDTPKKSYVILRNMINLDDELFSTLQNFHDYYDIDYRGNEINGGSLRVSYKGQELVDMINMTNNAFNSEVTTFQFDAADGVKFNFSNNRVTGISQLAIKPLSPELHDIEWEQFEGKIYDEDATNLWSEEAMLGFTEYSDLRNGAKDSSFFKAYEADIISNTVQFRRQMNLLGSFNQYYRARYNTESANEVYIALKDLETERLAFLYEQEKTFKSFFTWKINQFLKVFSAYGTEPARAIVFSIWVILAFALIYLFFPNHWDSHGKNRIVDRFSFFLKYMKKDAGMHDVYLEEKQGDILAYDDYKQLLENSGKDVPKFFQATGLPLYKWAISGTKLTAGFLSRVDVMKGTWSELPQSKRVWKSILLISAFLISLAYDIFIKMLNALMLSINTFTTLGFGEIPIKGLPRYLAIIQGFIGWFMLTIFSVSLISQLLN